MARGVPGADGAGPRRVRRTAAANTPDRRRYLILLAATASSITGLSAASTYTVPYLTQVGGFGPDAVSPLLFLRGAAGVAAMIALTAALALALFGLYGAAGAAP